MATGQPDKQEFLRHFPSAENSRRGCVLTHYVLDPETKSWEAFDPPGAPKPTADGIFGRWRHVPSLKAFVAVTAIDEKVHFYRPAAGT